MDWAGDRERWNVGVEMFSCVPTPKISDIPRKSMDMVTGSLR